MVVLIRFMNCSSKTSRKNICIRTTLNSQYSFYHVNFKLHSIKNFSKTNTPTLTSINFHTLSNRTIWHKNIGCVDPFTLQRRHFSFKESFESAVATHTSVFKLLSESTVVQYTQQFIVDFHDVTSLPWWLTIIAVTSSVRCLITFPLALYQSYVIARLENVRKEMGEITNNLRYEIDREIRKNKWSEKKARLHYSVTCRKEWTRLIERDNCHPAKTAILALIQIPTWVICSTALRNLVYMLPHQDTAAMVTKLGLSLGGLPWCTDLTMADSFIIPISLGLTNLAIIEIQAMMHQGEKTKLRRYTTNFFRGFSIFIIPVSALVPSAVSLYWLTSSMFGLCQNFVVMSPRVRRFFNFPTTASFNPHPYTHLAEQIKSKFRS